MKPKSYQRTDCSNVIITFNNEVEIFFDHFLNDISLNKNFWWIKALNAIRTEFNFDEHLTKTKQEISLI
jgi:hypothetical protein